MSAEGAKRSKGPSGAAARWFGLVGVIAAAAALALVPVSVDPEAALSNPGAAYYTAELRAFLAASVALLVAVAGMVVFDGRPLRLPVLLPVLALLGVSALSALFSERPAHSLYGDRGEGLLSVAAGVLLFYALARGLASRSRLRVFLAAAVTTAALVSVYGIAENYGFEPVSGWGNVPFADLGRSSATIGNSLTLSGYLTLSMGAAAALWMGAGTRLRRLVWLLALALIGACWIYAESRGALLGAALALPLVLLAARRRMGTLHPLAVPVAVLVAAMAVAVAASAAFGFSTLSLRFCAVLVAYLAFVGAFAWLLERGRSRLALLLPLILLVCAGAALAVAPGGLASSFGVSRGASGDGGDISMQTRLYIWRDTVPMILDRPLLGHGPDNFRAPSRPYISDDLRALIEDGRGEVRGLDRAHNHLLQVAATTGILGLAAYLWLLVSYFRNAYRRGGWVLAALSGAVLAYVLQLQTAFPSVATDVAFWGVLGASVAVMRLRDAEDAEPEEETEILPSREGPAATPDAETVVGSRRSRRRRVTGVGRGELPVAAAVVVLLVAIAVPTFLQQRERAAEFERVEIAASVQQAAQRYERIGRASGDYPEAGVYTSENPIPNARGRPAFRPSQGITITTELTPEGGFVMEGRSTSLAGTFTSTYDSPRRPAATTQDN
ncbi:hypothetical protein GBA65_18990 [Rubrobacter marinus]|uniref:O-antigen ligase-related domain-containing protein n=1 Tax=Rubrobacter marinus TaxID=2653852 RepID=A0A6G8Q1D5_9ACTN|nr:O-antigen ligase family protein [Rubrobacter marinus]QIN80258.1 hypothetical protein GBA65_18990 [Rubrobacter marinus]